MACLRNTPRRQHLHPLKPCLDPDPRGKSHFPDSISKIPKANLNYCCRFSFLFSFTWDHCGSHGRAGIQFRFQRGNGIALHGLLFFFGAPWTDCNMERVERSVGERKRVPVARVGNHTAETKVGNQMNTQLKDNPPRPCASKRVDVAPSNKPSKPPKPLNKPTRGRVYPPPTPSQTAFPSWLLGRLALSGLPWHLQKLYQNQWFFNIFAFWMPKSAILTHFGRKSSNSNAFGLKQLPF